jgi:hypothetical protein
VRSLAEMNKSVVLGVTLIVAGIVVWITRPSYRGYKERKFAAQAHEALGKGDQRRALLSAKQALTLNSNNVTACEVMADLADAGNSPFAIQWRARVAELKPTASNQIILAASALRYEQPPCPVAMRALSNAAPQGAQLPAFHVVSAQLALRQGKPAVAETHFETAGRLEPSNRVHRLNLATVQLQSRDPVKSAHGLEQLLALRSDTEVGIVALRSLAQHCIVRTNLTEALTHSAMVLQQPRASFEDSMIHARILREAKKPELAAFVEKLKQRASTNAVQTFALSGLLLSFGEAPSTIGWLKSLPAAMRDTQPVPMAVANAYAVAQQWRELEEYLKGQKWGEQDSTRLALLAFAVRHQNDETVALSHWNNAVKSAFEHPVQLPGLVQLTSGQGPQWRPQLHELLWRVAREVPDSGWAIEALHNSYSQLRDTRGLLATYSLMLERGATNNPLVQNNYASLSMLLSTNLPRAHQFAENVYQADTNNFAFISTYAWSKHLQGKGAEGLQLMSRLNPTILSEPAVAAYYSALLAANGKTNEARQYVAKAEKGEMLPEEKALVARTRAGLSATR